MKRRHADDVEEITPPPVKRIKMEHEAEEPESAQPAVIENMIPQLPETDYLYQQNVHLRAVERER
jgi:hypothetical protein